MELRVVAKVRVGVIYILFCAHTVGGVGFSTLSELKSYAANYPEYVKPDNEDWLRPDFSSFHLRNRLGLFGRMALRLGIYRNVWNARKFKLLIKSIVEMREKEGLRGEFIEQYKPHAGDKIVVWGDLLGAFHSLVRTLIFLHDQGIINDSFKIVKPNYVFVFNGNVIDGSPYALETLHVVLRLMATNSNRVFYVRGYYEDKERWHNLSIEQELKIRAYYVSHEAIPLNDLLIRFFNTLPLAFCLTHESAQTQKIVVMRNSEKVTQALDEKRLERLLDVSKNRGSFNGSKPTSLIKKKLVIDAYVTGEDRLVGFHKTDGLTMLSSIGAAMAWLVFSSPTERNQKLYQFFYDAFAQITVANAVSDWTISLWNQKVPELQGFKEVSTFNLLSGWHIKMKDQLKEEELLIGSTMDLSKGASPIGKRVKEGLELAFGVEHATNALPGIIPKLTTMDDEYTPKKSRSVVEDLIKGGTTIFVGSQGSASLEAYLDLVQSGTALVLFPLTGSPMFREPNLKYLIHYRGSYIREGEELIKYALTDLKSKRIAIFYQDDSFGRGALEGARIVLKGAGISDFLEVPHDRNVVNYKQQAEKINDFNPDTILFSTNTPAIRGLIHQMGVQYFAGKKLLGLSVYEDAFERFLRDKGLSFTLIRMVPDPQTSDLEIVKEYRLWADKNNLSYDKVSLEQFINANILFEILKQVIKPITKEKIIAVAEGMKQYHLKGLVLDFNPRTRELSNTLWIDPGYGAWILKINQNAHGAGGEIDTKKEVATTARKDTLFRVGSVLDLSRGIKALSTAVKAGIELRIIEDAGSNVFVPQVVFVDDQYTPSITLTEVNNLIKNGITTLLLSTGSPTLEAYLHLVKEGKVLVLFPITGAPLFRTVDLLNIVHLRASYDQEGRALTRYSLDILKRNKLLLFYQDDAFGKGLLQASREFLKEKTVSFKEVAYDRNNLNFKKQVQEIQEYAPDAILFFSTATAARSLMRQIGISNLVHTYLIGCSDLGDKQLVKFAREANLKLIYANVVPNPDKSTLEIVKQFRNAANKHNVVFDPLSLEAYIATDLLLRVLREIGDDVTNEKILARLTSIKDENYKGLKLRFDPNRRTLMHSIWIDTGDDEWLEIDVD